MSDYQERAEYYAQIRRANRSGNRYDCPTCGAKNALSQHDKSQGYHCKACTRAIEGPAYDQNETSYYGD